MTQLPDAAPRLALLRQFLHREDVVAILAPWGKACPAVPVTTMDEVLLAHLGGGPATAVVAKKPNGDETLMGRWRVGSYCIAHDQTVRWLCIDFDGKGHATPLLNPENAAVSCLRSLHAAGLPAYLERSGRGQGWHVWCFFCAPISAAKARALGHLFAPKDAVLAAGGYADPNAGHGIEVFPKQDTITDGGYGNLVWLPWWHGAPEGANEFYRDDGSAELQLYLPESFEVIDEAAIDRLLKGRDEPEADGDGGAHPDWRAWRAEALGRLSLSSIYGDWLTGRQRSKGWLECRDPDSPTGDKHPSAGVADGNGEAERGVFHSFISGKTLSVFNFLMARGRASDFRGALKVVEDLAGVPLPSSMGRSTASLHKDIDRSDHLDLRVR